MNQCLPFPFGMHSSV